VGQKTIFWFTLYFEGEKQKRRKGLERGKRDSDEASLEKTKEQVEGR